MIVSVMVCSSNGVYANVDNGLELSISIDADSSEDTSLGGNGCDMSCGGCCHLAVDASHSGNLASASDGKLLMPDTNLFVSDVIYGLKRPPRS